MAPRCATSRDRGQRPQEVPVIKKHTLIVLALAAGLTIGFLTAAQLGSRVKETAGYDKTALSANAVQTEQLSKRILFYQKENARLRKEISELKNIAK